jgi:hypothetical protein
VNLFSEDLAAAFEPTWRRWNLPAPPARPEDVRLRFGALTRFEDGHPVPPFALVLAEERLLPGGQGPRATSAAVIRGSSDHGSRLYTLTARRLVPLARAGRFSGWLLVWCALLADRVATLGFEAARRGLLATMLDRCHVGSSWWIGGVRVYGFGAPAELPPALDWHGIDRRSEPALVPGVRPVADVVGTSGGEARDAVAGCLIRAGPLPDRLFARTDALADVTRSIRTLTKRGLWK